MRRFGMMVLMTLTMALMACDCGERSPVPGGGRGVEACQPNPTAPRAKVSVIARNEADELDHHLRSINVPTQKGAWDLRYDAGSEQSGKLPTNAVPELRQESDPLVTLDARRGQRVTFSFSALGTEAITHTVPLDRSCELVLIVGDELENDGETVRFTLAHEWR